MKANSSPTKKLAIALISIMLATVPTFSFAALVPLTSPITTTTSTLQAGSGASIKRPPVSATPTGTTTTTTLTVPQRTGHAYPEGKAIVDARYDLDLPLCPPNNNLCPDINNKCTNPAGGCRDMKLPVTNIANYNKCPETCRVSRVTTGWNAVRNAPESSVEAVCPAGYATLAAYNLGPEYRTAVGASEIQLPWPIVNPAAASYPSYFYNPTNYRCGVYGQYSVSGCQMGKTLSPPQNVTPLNGTIAATYPSSYGWISLSYDYGYTNYGADINTPPNINPTCYKDSGCTVADSQTITWCTTNAPSWLPAGCNAWNFGSGWMCIYGSKVCLGTDPWGVCNNWGCTGCTASSYYRITRTVYPNICWYKGGKLIPGAGQIPTSLVCGRMKQTWK